MRTIEVSNEGKLFLFNDFHLKKRKQPSKMHIYIDDIAKESENEVEIAKNCSCSYCFPF